MTTQAHQPWKPTCWVGGVGLTVPSGKTTVWINDEIQQLCDMDDDGRAKYAATKATAAILRAMRIKSE